MNDRATVSSAIDNIPSPRIYPTGIPIGCMTDMKSAQLLAERSSLPNDRFEPFDWFFPGTPCPTQRICAPSPDYDHPRSPSHAYTERSLTA